MEFLREVTEGFRENRNYIDASRNEAGLAIEALSIDQQQQLQAMRELATEVQRTGVLSNNRAAQHWADLEGL